MEGFILLLLQMTLLLLAAALVFFLLGWRWRSQDAKRDAENLQRRLDSEASALHAAYEERDEARQKQQALEINQTQQQAELQEASDHRRNLERELIRVHEDLKSARQNSEQDREETAKARTTLQAAQEKADKLTKELEKALREKTRCEEEITRLHSQPPIATPPLTEAPPEKPTPAQAVSKPKRTRKPTTTAADSEAQPPTTTKKTKAPKPSLNAQATLAALASELATKQTFLNALRQELDDWQRRVATLRAKGNDPAGLGLASKSLSRAETQVATAAADVEHLQHQQTALQRSLEQSADIPHEDDLTRIKGIKSVLRDQLHTFGVRTFQQIAEWTDQDVEAFSELLAFKDRAKRDEWVKQARELL